jgi:hypothetical protein
VLDRKFIPHSSHYINHTKHNLEYGYQVMGLTESTKKGRREKGIIARAEDGPHPYNNEGITVAEVCRQLLEASLI